MTASMHSSNPRVHHRMAYKVNYMVPNEVGRGNHGILKRINIHHNIVTQRDFFLDIDIK